MVIRNGFVKNMDGCWVPLRDIKRFYVQVLSSGDDCVWRVVGQDVDGWVWGISGDYDTDGEAHIALDGMMGYVEEGELGGSE